QECEPAHTVRGAIPLQSVRLQRGRTALYSGQIQYRQEQGLLLLGRRVAQVQFSRIGLFTGGRRVAAGPLVEDAAGRFQRVARSEESLHQEGHLREGPAICKPLQRDRPKWLLRR